MIGFALSQFSLWVFVILAIAATWVVWFAKSRKDIQTPCVISGAALVLISLVYVVGMETTSDISDHCFLNGQLQSATYEEEYTREYTTTESYTDSKGNSKTRTVTKREHVPPSWSSRDSLGNSYNINEADYVGYMRRFGNQVKTGNGHSDQVSYGNGRTFQTRWDGTEATIIPWTVKESVVNWVRGSKFTILKKAMGQEPCLAYPDLIEVQRGPKLPRVLLEGVQVTPAWKEAMEWNLDVLAAKVGPTRQCNPILYLTNKPASQAQNISDHWIGGKKNDVVIVIGTQQWPKVDWVQTISWSKKTEFGPMTQEALQDVNLDDGTTLTQTIGNSIFNHYERRPMKEFEYLKNEIPTPIGIYIIAGILALLAPLMFFFLPDFEAQRQARFSYRRW